MCIQIWYTVKNRKHIHMLKKIIRHLLEPKHFWRDVGFDELSELYVSSMLHTLAVSLLMVFVPFYLFQQGYSIPAIFSFFGLFFVGRVVSDILAGFMVARFGPKHTMILSSMLQISSAALFLTIPSHHWPIWLMGPAWGASMSFYFIAFHVAFSKIKHIAHAGKEIGYMNIMDKVGAIAGPLVGGLIGTIFGAQYIFLVATLVLLLSLWPLFLTKEPVVTHQKLDFKGFPVHKVYRDIFAWAAMGTENTLCINLWPLYISLFALGGRVYAQLGALSSFAVVSSITASYAIGRLVDIKHARLTLRFSASLNALLYLFRPLVHSVWPALGVSVANEAITTGYRIPFIKGMYAAADALPGHRIMYFVAMESIGSLAKGTAWFVLALCSLVFATRSVIILGFVLAAAASMLILSERFHALKPQLRNVE